MDDHSPHRTAIALAEKARIFLNAIRRLVSEMRRRRAFELLRRYSRGALAIFGALFGSIGVHASG